MAREAFPPISIPDDLSPGELPDLLRYWYLGTRARRHMMIKRFAEVDSEVAPRSDSAILDVGSGWGFNLLALEMTGHRAVGVDLVEGPLAVGARIARANGVVFKAVCADAASLPFPDAAFGAVTMVETIEHVYAEDRTKVIEECRRVLRRGGLLVLSTPNYYGLVERAKRVVQRSEWLRKKLPTMCYPTASMPRASYHPHRYHLPLKFEEIKGAIEAAGFKLVRVKRVVFVLKNTPNIVFSAFAIAEKLLEKTPLLKRLASTIIIVCIKT